MKTLYTIGATATGGRNGHVKSDNAGYSACFDSALNLVIKSAKIQTGETTVTAKVGIGQIENGGFGLEVELHANIPGVTIEEAQDLIEKAHQVCPYSNATRGNIEVKLTVSNN